jgi:hypothetical protein
MRGRSSALAVCLTLAFALAGCRNEEADALRSELAALAEQRVKRETAERAQQELAEVEAARAAREDELAARRSELARLEREVAEIEGRYARTAERYQERVGENGRELADVERMRRRLADWRAEAELAQAEAGFARKQAQVFAREIRPSDPAWATERRLEALRHFLAQTAEAWPDDPVLASLAQAELPAVAGSPGEPAPGRALAAAALAKRAAERLAEVYGLEAPAPVDAASVASPPPGS